MSIPGIGPISAAVIYAEYGDISNFSNPGQMLAFAGIEPGINDSGTESHGGRMVKHGSSQLRYVLLNACLPLIRFDITFASYYAKKRADGSGWNIYKHGGRIDVGIDASSGSSSTESTSINPAAGRTSSSLR